MGSGKESMVLPCAPSRLPNTTANTATHTSTNCPAHCPTICPTSRGTHTTTHGTYSTTQTSRPVQLCGWICQLDGRLVGWEESVVLQGAWKGLPTNRGWMWHNVSTL